MSSLLQFSGSVTRRGVGLRFVHVIPSERWPNLPGDAVDVVPCETCGRSHGRIHIAYRRPAGMCGPWVGFRYNGETHYPDLSIPIPVFRLPRGARPVSDEENARIWHST